MRSGNHSDMGEDKWPAEVWAVEYTAIGGERRVAVMPDLTEAVGWIDNLGHHGAAEPVLLRSDAAFEEFG